MTNIQAIELLKKEGIYLAEAGGKLKMKYEPELAGTGYLKGIRTLFKENLALKESFIKTLTKKEVKKNEIGNEPEFERKII